MSALVADRPEGTAEHTRLGSAWQAYTPNDGNSGRQSRTDGLREYAQSSWPALAIAGILCAITFIASGGLNLDSMTTTEIALTIGCGVAIAAVVALLPLRRLQSGSWAVALMLAFAAFSALSVIWSVQPDASWQAASRLLAYSGVFALAVLLAQVAPRRSSAVLGGIVLACAVVCGYALLTKVFPNRLGSEQVVYYARLREPFGYWNAIGLCAALGAICCMWLGARRTGHALLSALAYPALGMMLVTLMLAYSRGALVAFALGAALWLCLIPLRLRGATVLLVGALGAGVVVAWDFSQQALTTDSATLPARILAGHQLGVLLAAALLLLTLAGLAIGFASARHKASPAARRHAGTLLLSIPVLAVLALVVALAASHRGLTGTVSHDLGSLTNPNASVPANGPGRLTAIGSARARYWKEAFEVFEAHPIVGAGAEGYATARLRYRTAPLKVQQAHGFIVQTLADLGLVGLLIVLALLTAWCIAAGRATHPFNRRWSGWRWRRWPSPANRGQPRGAYTPERVGLLTMVCVVFTFGVHSFVDWTWYVPGLACIALLCAGWLAGRGELNEDSATLAPMPTPEPAGSDPTDAQRTAGARRWVRDRHALGAAAAIAIAALLAAWAEWQPQRSQNASNQALALLAHDPKGAVAAAQSAVNRDPLSAEALITLAAIQQGAGERADAAATYRRAVRLQPSNWQTWEALGEYELNAGKPKSALNALRAAVYLNPEAIAPRGTINEELLALQDDYLQALRETSSTAIATTHGTTHGTGASARTPSARATPSAVKSGSAARTRAGRAALRGVHRSSA